MTNQPSVVIDKDYVVIEGTKIARPTRMGCIQWLEWWGQEKFYAHGIPHDDIISFREATAILPAHNP